MYSLKIPMLLVMIAASVSAYAQVDKPSAFVQLDSANALNVYVTTTFTNPEDGHIAVYEINSKGAVYQPMIFPAGPNQLILPHGGASLDEFVVEMSHQGQGLVFREKIIIP